MVHPVVFDERATVSCEKNFFNKDFLNQKFEKSEISGLIFD